VVAGAALVPGLACAAAGSGFVRVSSENPPYVLFKPAAWALRHEAAGDTLRISVASPDGRSVAEVVFTDNRTRRLDTLGLLGRQLEALHKRSGPIAVTEAVQCKDEPPSCAAVTLAYTADGVPMRARYFVHGGAETTSVRSYRAPAARQSQDRTVLLDVLTNIHVRPLRPIAVRYVARHAADRSASLETPPDWSFIGGKGAAIATAPQGRAGFVFTVFTMMPQSYGVRPPPGVIVAPYRPPQASILDVFAQFRNRQTRVLSVQPDAQSAAQCAARIGRACEVADLQLSWVSPEGVPCLGGFKVLNARPNLAGQWFSIVAGIWGPGDDLWRHLPVLAHVAGSFAIDDAYAKRYIENGMANLRVLQQRTQQAVQSLYGAIEQNQRDYEARVERKEASDAKWDDYARGNSYWVSALEGGKVYRTDPWGTQDTQTGTRYDGAPTSYIHFDGQNPVHASEQMHEISSHDLKRMNP
jgi:hypothetical protein